MGFKCGIVGLPNVGKSTLFNALTKTASAQAANFPFCTIEPNIGRVAVPDERLDQISNITKSATTIPTQLEFVDIAGLVKGASKGEGLGNQFLANIRETDAIIHVLRCFENGDITHVEGSVDPLRDKDIIETELMLADLESVEKRLQSLAKKARSGDKESKQQMDMLEKVKTLLDDGRPARELERADQDEEKCFQMLQLITGKKVLYVCNVNEEDAATGNDWTKQVQQHAEQEGSNAVVISAAIEEEISQLDDDEQKEFLESLDLTEPGLNRVIRAGYELLGLSTYFTSGPKETRAWTIRKESKAPQAAGVIHTDFEKGFIRAETISYKDFIDHKGEQGAKEAGKMRSEGKEYIVQDGDILLFRFNV